MSNHSNMITWYAIGGAGSFSNKNIPDAEMEVLIYDKDLDDVVLGHLDDDGVGPVWIDSATGEPLPAPVYWAEKPFPLGV